ncbi:hypothetical protein HK100_010380, partial [Physocladia obscura]
MMMASLILLFLASLTVLASRKVNEANGCATVDASGNVYTFGGVHGDFNIGADPESWTTNLAETLNASGSVTNLTNVPGRPPFTSANIICLSAHFLNAAVFLNADPADDTSIHKFDFSALAWSRITTTTTNISGITPNMEKLKAVIDHDTLVIYAFDNGRMLRLGDADRLNLNNNLTTIPWEDANFNFIPPQLSSTNYTATMGQGWISIYFFGVPTTTNGEVWGYRIHYNEWSSEPQFCDSDFKPMHGETATFTFRNASENTHDGAPSHIAYIPDDYSAVYIIDSYINMTTTCAAPPKEGTSLFTRYVANDNYLVQYTPDTGVVRFLDLGWLFSGHQRPDISNLGWTDATVFSEAASDGSGVDETSSLASAAKRSGAKG